MEKKVKRSATTELQAPVVPSALAIMPPRYKKKATALPFVPEPCRGSGGTLPQKIFKFGGPEMLFSALVMRYVSEKSTSNMKMANNESQYNQNN